ncbi:MAG: Carbamoyl-phosphate synthase large chain [Phycisphaerae bacterium]|nr:Carbamoyl-phosphate synthase large chain [Phycisphaerae bacterium]
MPRHPEIKRVLIIGSGPIVIGQGCEFDYSGTQACKALREEGISVVLLNSNPATIMTDPQTADRTYIEPITPRFLELVLAREKQRGTPIDSILPTLGGQTALNCAMAAVEQGLLEKYGVRLIGADYTTIHRAEDRTAFKETVLAAGLEVPRSGVAHSIADAEAIIRDIGLPCVIRPAFTLGGSGGGHARTREEFDYLVRSGLDASRNHEILVEESVYGWKEFELELMRDRRDNVVVICAIENLDPMGVHTGDSITVAPAQTLTDREYQQMRDAAITVMRAIGVETGGSNVQFAVHPKTGRLVAIEMNPRVSRSSALASKATGFPIAKIAAKLAIGYTLDEITNDITRETPACFEPTIDYCVVKMPRWTFEKFPESDQTLTTQMKSVGEAMAIGRSFAEAFQKCIRSMEIKRNGLGLDQQDRWLDDHEQQQAARTADPGLRGWRHGEAPHDWKESAADHWPIDEAIIHDKLSNPSQGRPYYIRYAFKLGWSIDRVNELTQIDRWFLAQIKRIVDFEDRLLRSGMDDPELESVYHEALKLGYSFAQLARAWRCSRSQIHALAEKFQGHCYKAVDTCAAEFEAYTPYFYSTHETPYLLNGTRQVDNEAFVPDKPAVMIIGGGPNRIGQGIEFDYCCVHAVQAVRAAGLTAVMINSNPETVSTDYDTSDMLFFEPLVLEDVLNVCRQVRPNLRGVVVQFGGQTPLNLARSLAEAGLPILGTTPAAIHLAEDRASFQKIMDQLGLVQPPSAIAHTVEEAVQAASRIGYPVLVRPSYVLGGRAMEICNQEADLRRYMHTALGASDLDAQPTILIDQFLQDAIEVDVDAVADYGVVPGHLHCAICGVMEHIEEAGIHSGDSACALPPYTLSPAIIDEIKRQTRLLAEALQVCGLMNVQFAIKGRRVYVLEVNPRASRTVPFVSKATGVPWAKVAMEIMLGEPLAKILARYDYEPDRPTSHVSVKEVVFPFEKFPGVDVVLGPEMRSTGEVMGIDRNFALAFAKAQIAAHQPLPTSGTVYLSVNDGDKAFILPIARQLSDLGFQLVATHGTHHRLCAAGLTCDLVARISDNPDNNAVTLLQNHKLQLLINTATVTGRFTDEGRIRSAAVRYRVPLITTMTEAQAAVQAITALHKGQLVVRALQDYLE